MPVRLSSVITAEAQPRAPGSGKAPGDAALVLSDGAGRAQLAVPSGPHIDGPAAYDWSFIMNSRAEVGAARERLATERRDGAA
jgi:redox-sensitive bicupin YhaK (pirin superfamily)